MTERERERTRKIHGNLFAYRRHKQAVDAFATKAMCQGGMRLDGVGAHGSFHSDPAARAGLLLADPPARIRNAMDWCAAIEDAWAECRSLDDGKERGLSYLLEQNFCLTGKERSPDGNREERARICSECRISESTFYVWLNRITDIVRFHAEERKLI